MRNTLEKINAFELPCLDSRKSFYGKARIIVTDEGKYLQSYNTIVCFLSYNRTFIKLWDGYSVTTMRHVNSFLKYYNIDTIDKTLWSWIECGVCYDSVELGRGFLKRVGF